MEKEQTPANILMIQADQLTAMALGCYGHPVARTPNIDRLAESGTCFRNAYCNSPLCGPSRNSMMSGRLPHKIGSYDNANELPAAVPTFAHALRNTGYELWMSGKMHFVGPDQLHGLHGRVTTDIYPSDFEWTPDWSRGTYGNAGTSVHYLHQSGVCEWGLQLDYDEEVQAAGLRCLRDLVRRCVPQEQPFFLCVSFTHPHEPFHVSREYWDRYEDVDIPMPGVDAKPLDEMCPSDRWIQIHHEIDRYPPSAETIRAARRAYLGMVSYVDDKVGELVAELERLGVQDNTAVIFTSDHGDMQGEHGMWYKRTFREWAMRVPIIIKDPRMQTEANAKGLIVDEPVSLVDLFPTLTEIGGVASGWPGSEHLDGTSLIPLCRGDTDGAPRRVFAEYCGEGVTEPLRLLRKGKWKYVDVREQVPLLFDLDNDPNETVSLTGDPLYTDVVEEMRSECLEDWDADALKREIMADQQRRLFIDEALARGEYTSWDFQPDTDVTERYIRRGKNTQGTKNLQRWPYVAPDEP